MRHVICVEPGPAWGQAFRGVSEAEEAQITFLFRAGKVCGQPQRSELTLNKYFTYAQLKSYRLGRERERQEVGERRGEVRSGGEQQNRENDMIFIFSFFFLPCEIK